MDNLHLLEAFLVFAAPGPTNALLAAGAVKRQNATTLLAAQACGYGIAAAFWLSLRSLVPPATVQMVQLVAAAWLVILGFRLLAAKRAEATGNGGGISLLATTALNPKAFIYCVAIVPMDHRGGRAEHRLDGAARDYGSDRIDMAAAGRRAVERRQEDGGRNRRRGAHCLCAAFGSPPGTLVRDLSACAGSATVFKRQAPPRMARRKRACP
ncbi:hypothetical protein [Mesorhizobium sp.]|uniref:hypothetical protein n=1 Tax=Mesorhizobium sp. TaxID=1871066 RepID=UPI0025C14C83|nr:hypothetical protein [Mesorhizobium sp.]